MRRKPLMMEAIKFVSARRRNQHARRVRSPDPRTYSLHIRVRAFAAFGDEAVDPRSDNRERYQAELEHGIATHAS